MSSLNKISDSIFNQPESTYSNGFILTLLTPALFAKGWLPDWPDSEILTGTLPHIGLQVRLCAAAIDCWLICKPVSSLLSGTPFSLNHARMSCSNYSPPIHLFQLLLGFFFLYLTGRTSPFSSRRISSCVPIKSTSRLRKGLILSGLTANSCHSIRISFCSFGYLFFHAASSAGMTAGKGLASSGCVMLWAVKRILARGRLSGF